MTITNRAVPLLHRKEWQMMTPAPVATAAGAFVVHDGADLDNLALLVASATTHYLYHHDEDAWVQIPSGALAGTFGRGPGDGAGYALVKAKAHQGLMNLGRVVVVVLDH